MWFKNLKIYRLSAPLSDYAEQLELGLKRHSFQSGNNLEMQSLGWIAPREGGELTHPVTGRFLLSMRAEKKLLPPP